MAALAICGPNGLVRLAAQHARKVGSPKITSMDVDEKKPVAPTGAARSDCKDEKATAKSAYDMDLNEVLRSEPADFDPTDPTFWLDAKRKPENTREALEWKRHQQLGFAPRAHTTVNMTQRRNQTAHGLIDPPRRAQAELNACTMLVDRGYHLVQHAPPPDRSEARMPQHAGDVDWMHWHGEAPGREPVYVLFATRCNAASVTLPSAPDICAPASVAGSAGHRWELAGVHINRGQAEIKENKKTKNSNKSATQIMALLPAPSRHVIIILDKTKRSGRNAVFPPQPSYLVSLPPIPATFKFAASRPHSSLSSSCSASSLSAAVANMRQKKGEGR